jgi:RecA-family ATPase
MAHTLIHWPYHLNEWVIDHLRRQGVFADEKILERERWSHKRRTKYANETVDAMDQDGEIDRLWRDFNLNLKNARGAKVSSYFPLHSCTTYERRY